LPASEIINYLKYWSKQSRPKMGLWP